MSQPLITRFYNKRKRAAEGFATDSKSKVLVLEAESQLSVSEGSTFKPKSEYSDEIRKLVYHVKRQEHEKVIACNTSVNLCVVQTQEELNKLEVAKVENEIQAKAAKITVVPQTNNADIRLAFKPKVLNNICDSSERPSEVLDVISDCNKHTVSAHKNDALTPEKRIVFELLGGLSPKKRNTNELASPVKQTTNKTVEVKNARRDLGLMSPKKIIEQKSKGVSLDEIRSKLNRSSRLAEIRESIKKFNRGDQALREIEVQKKKFESSSPQLQKFTAIAVEVPVSPQKAVSVASSLSSPVKGSPLKRSPVKSLLTSPVKLPAFQRLAHLVKPGVPSLPLPYKYRMLEEIFSCMDSVTSMMYNRKETVTFDKLKSGVQQMLRRNFTEQHMGQIKTVLPDAFEFSQEKCSTVMSSKKTSKYQLTIMPVIDSKQADVSRIRNGSGHSIMTPSLLVERRDLFHKNLLEFIMDHHEEFLKKHSLIIPRAKLARWHPGFELESVPPVAPAELPAAPTEEKLCTAKDVLDRAKTLFGCNQRMEKALQMVSQQMKKSEENNSSQVTSNTSNSNASLFKGVPKALLEKVRARQAAKAFLTMTRTPAEDREATQLLRLPEIVRILRNIFVAEKKNVLPLEVTLEKLSNSYREVLSSGELEQHIRLLIKVIPGWVDILHVRKTDYVKVAKDADMSAVMKKLEKLAADMNSKM